MPKVEKIGQDVLGYEPPKETKYDRRKRELMEKAKEELRKKQKKEPEEEEKLPKEKVPGEKVEGEPIFVTEAEAEAMAESLGLKGKEKEVYVREHYRSKPKKKDEYPEWAIIYRLHCQIPHLQALVEGVRLPLHKIRTKLGLLPCTYLSSYHTHLLMQ